MRVSSRLMAVVVAVFTSLNFGCVSTKLYKDLQAEHAIASQEVERLTDENESLSVANNEFNARYAGLEKRIENLKKDSAAHASVKKRLERENERLQLQYDDLKKSQDALLRGSADETRSLLKQIQANQEDLQKREDKLAQLQSNLEAERRNLQQLKNELEDRNARLLELEQVLARKDSAVLALREKVSNALLGFEEQGLQVSIKNGKVYVSLDEKLLFGSGSTEVDPKGVAALKKLAGVLERNPDINIMIEGHTDDVPIKSGSAMKDNWDLSVQRATSIVRILLANSNIDPTRLTASGRGEYMPVENAKTASARQKNRRTEIILTPKLDELFEILDAN